MSETPDKVQNYNDPRFDSEDPCERQSAVLEAMTEETAEAVERQCQPRDSNNKDIINIAEQTKGHSQL